ncbi:unnamed protein product [Brassica oleracea var. botrytis]
MSLAEAQQRTLTQPFDLRLRLSPPEISQRQLHEQAQMRSFIQERALKQPSPETFDMAQAEGIVGEIHSNEMELERLNSLLEKI